jgi:hypothetical protein
MTTKQALLERVDLYLRDKNMTERAFGQQVMSDPKFIWSLRNGRRSIRLSTLDRIEAFMAGQPFEPPRPRRTTTARVSA